MFDRNETCTYYIHLNLACINGSQQVNHMVLQSKWMTGKLKQVDKNNHRSMCCV